MHASLTQTEPLNAGATPCVRADLATLVREQFGFVWRALRRLGVAAGDADDAAQQVFLVLARKLPEIEPGAEKAFLFGTAVRIASRARRTKQRRRENLEETFDELLASTFVSGDPDPEQALEQRQATELLSVILDTLPDELRAAFVLCEIEQLTMSEASELLDVPQGTIASRLRRAREQYDVAVERLRKRMTRNRGGE
jgi:RNA polymerase sigma-70 factor, ECF subfamily